MMLAFPWLFMSFVVSTGVVFAMPQPDAGGILGQVLGQFVFASGAVWSPTWGDSLVASTLVLLFIQMLKTTRVKALSTLDHLLSLALFMICLVEFVARKEAATSVFFFITLVALIDLILGFVVPKLTPAQIGSADTRR